MTEPSDVLSVLNLPLEPSPFWRRDICLIAFLMGGEDRTHQAIDVVFLTLPFAFIAKWVSGVVSIGFLGPGAGGLTAYRVIGSLRDPSPRGWGRLGKHRPVIFGLGSSDQLHSVI